MKYNDLHHNCFIALWYYLRSRIVVTVPAVAVTWGNYVQQIQKKGSDF